MPSTRKQMLRSVESRIAQMRDALATLRQIPRGGWIRTIREALGLTTAQLGQRVGITPQGIHALEMNERKGSITLDSLRRAAHAMDAELVYAIVPREALQTTLERQARAVAEKHFARVARSMRLEQQGVNKTDLEEQVNEYARALLERPKQLWR